MEAAWQIEELICMMRGTGWKGTAGKGSYCMATFGRSVGRAHVKWQGLIGDLGLPRRDTHGKRVVYRAAWHL